VLTVTGLSNAEYLISSVALSIDEYYAGVGESPGVWAGRWAEALGVSGVVEADQLRALVDGKHPSSGVDLLAGSRARSVLAFDLTFSAPKSVSLLWALAQEPVADAVAAAHREAVEVALGFLEERAAIARLQTKGVRHRVETGGWAVAGFVHRTSREGDPQLHTHCLVPNLVQRAGDGHHVAFDAAPLFEWARAAGSIYQNHLQASLSRKLGVSWGPDRNNTREMEGFTRAQLRAFSKRSAQIEAELEAKGATYETPALRMQADDEASLATRPAKDHSLTPSLLAGRWQQEAEQVGLATGADLERAVCSAGRQLEPLGWEEITAALVDPEVGLCSRSARFTRADVVEQICAMSGGRLTAEEIAAMADRFVGCELAVRLCPEAEGGRRRPAQWSTAAHRALEDRTLALIDALAARPAAAIGEAATEFASGALDLGDDQLAAVRVLAGEGASLRAVLSPAGYGKTTMLHAAARAAAADGRPVVAVATTARAVAELAGAGLDAKTIARLRIELSDGPLAAGTVVVLDEISQTPTAEVEAVLAAVDACPGGSIWVLGDPRQSQPVGAGGAADHIDRLATAGRIPSARLTVNRRQVDATDRAALDLLRRGDPAGSQALRDGKGWEHEHASPAATRQAMARAVCEDIDRYGAEQVSALVVSHADAEHLADLIRLRLAERGGLSGPSLVGPGWTDEREYRAGDRVLLHARCGPSGSRLVNGTTATVTKVGPAGLIVGLDGGDAGEAVLPGDFVAGTRKDGAPKVSHAWARTVDGAQGGTWQSCHLLGSSALDAYRGYTGQSRSRRPTHTWNTTRVELVDHGGALSDQRDGAQQVADALGHRPDPSLAARSDPSVLDRQLRQRIAEHDRVLSGRPPDRNDALAAENEALRSARRALAELDAAAARSGGDVGRLAGVRRHGRNGRRFLHDRPEDDTRQAAAARARHDALAARVEGLWREQQAHDCFEQAEGWRRDEVARLYDQLDRHWARVIAACVGADDPLAYGVDRLRHARATLIGDRRAIEAGVPEDRAEGQQQARRQLRGIASHRRDAEALLADSLVRLDYAARRRWGRHDRQALADAQARVVAGDRRVEETAAAERDLRERLAALAEHQQRRLRRIADNAPHIKELDATLAQISGALDRTLPDRVAALAADPPGHLVSRIGPAPETTAGRAVWCHYALDIEAAVDRNDGRSPTRTGWSPLTEQARRQIAVADRVLQVSSDRLGPAEWAELARRAGAILDLVCRAGRNHAARQRTPGQWQQAQPAPWIDPVAGGPQSGISM
jgi:conjugative relaxase-like TrwC/TraI family protein